MAGVGTRGGIGLHRLASGLALALVAAGLLVLAGWHFDVATLKSVLPGLVTMKPNTAMGLLLIGVSLFLARPRVIGSPAPMQRRLARFFAAAVFLLGLLTLGQMLVGQDFGIDQLLFRESVLVSDTLGPGRMSPIAAMNFVLIGAALLLLEVETRDGLRPANWLALAVAADSFLAILGYLYGVDAFYRIAAYTSMAVHTAVLFVVASLAVMVSRPQSRLVAQIAGDNIGGIISRRLLPAAFGLPPLFGWVLGQGQLAGYFSSAFGLALFTAANTLVFVLLAWWSSRGLQRVHDLRVADLQTNDWTQAMLDSADVTVISTDAEGVIRTINARAAQSLGYAPEELIGKFTPGVLHDPAEVAARAEVVSKELGRQVDPGLEVFVAKARGGVRDENDWTYVRKDGSRFMVRLSVTRLVDAHGRLTGFLGVGNDVTAVRKAEAKLWAQAQTDTLTGLPNRSQLTDRLAHEIARSERSGIPMAVVFIDMDNFKAINDGFGHAGGDLALQEVSRRLTSVLRATDMVARLSGDEFVVLLASVSVGSDAAVVVRKLMAAMAAPFSIDGRPITLSCSYGVTVRRAGEVDADALLKRADAALYRVKASGRGGFFQEE